MLVKYLNTESNVVTELAGTFIQGPPGPVGPKGDDGQGANVPENVIMLLPSSYSIPGGWFSVGNSVNLGGSVYTLISQTESPTVVVDSVVIIGASLMYAMFGSDLELPHETASNLLSASGHDLPVYGYAKGGARLDVADDYYTAARAAHPNALILMHFGGNDVSSDRPYPGGEVNFNTRLSELLAVSNGDERFYPANLTFRDYDDTTFQVPENGSKPYNENILIPWISENFPHAVTSYGRPKLDFYRRSLQDFETWLSSDNVHMTDAGYSEFREWIISRVVDLLENNAITEIPERVYEPDVPFAPTITSNPSIAGYTSPGSVLTVDPGEASGDPSPTYSVQWRIDGVDQSGETDVNYTRPATIGAVPSVIVTWSNGTAPNASATVTAVATTEQSQSYPALAASAGSPTYAAGKFGQAADTSGGFRAQAASPLMPAGVNWGVEGWYKVPTVSGSNIAWGEAGNNRAYMVVRSGGNSPAGQACITYEGPSGQTHMTGGPRIDDGAWHHVAVQFSDAGAQLFVDGVSVANSTRLINSGQSNLNWTVGMYGDSGNYQWTGQIDEILIWSGVRYSAGFTPRTSAYTSLPSGTVSYWSFDGNLNGGVQ